MDAAPLARIRLTRKPAKERRTKGRDRRLLEATMKYRGEFHHVEVRDLSLAGAFAIAPVIPVLADSITLNIELPLTGETVMITGRVRRVGLSSRSLEQPGGFGLEFTRFYSSLGRQCLEHHLDC